MLATTTGHPFAALLPQDPTRSGFLRARYLMLNHMRHQSSTFLQRLIASLLCIVCSSLTTVHAQDTTTYIRAGGLFDGRSDKLQEKDIIVVQGKKIFKVGKGKVFINRQK